MRALLVVPLTLCLAVSQAEATPTAQEQANYDAACVAVVEAVNAFRTGNGKAALVPLVELCQAAREDTEFFWLGVGVSKPFFDRASDAGYTGTFLTGSTAFYSSSQAAAAVLFQNLISGNASNQAAFLNIDAASIGVGFALEAVGASSEYQVRIILGKKVGGLLGGTTGQETGSGRGLLSFSLIPEIRAGAWAGDSINGFVRDPNVVVLTKAEERAVAAALSNFLRSKSVVRLSVGGAVKLKLPREIVAIIQKYVVSGKLPPGVKFDKRTGGFRGSARTAGTFTVTLSGDLRASVNGSKRLKPIRIHFTIGS